MPVETIKKQSLKLETAPQEKVGDNWHLQRPGETRVRIAPSPTGPLHVGHARTALFNFLFAKKYQGAFVLRIDDTDKERSQHKWEKDIIDGLKFLGIFWQEGPDKAGPLGPYRQSERGDIYQKYIEKLLQEKKLYHCFCSHDDLKAEKQYLLSLGKPFRYSGKCRNLSDKQIAEKLKAKTSYVLRLKAPPSKEIVFEDVLRGKIEHNTEAFGDIVLAKNENQPLYNLASVIDDIEMKITHVIRGEDHIPNTPKQIIILEALGKKIPQYIHLPLILGADRSKLSSRHGAKSILEYKKQGYLPETLINFLALLGWNPDTNKEVFSLSSLIQEFAIEKIQKSGAVFNVKKLDWLNGFYIRQKPLDKLTELCLPYLIESGLIAPLWEQKEIVSGGLPHPFDVVEYQIEETKEKINFDYIKNIIALCQERLKRLAEIIELTDFFFKAELDYNKNLLQWKEMTDKEIQSSIDTSKKILSKIKIGDWTKEKIEAILMAEADKIGDRGALLWPLRAALTGKQASAGPFDIAALLGKEKTLKRLKQAHKILKHEA